MWLGAEFLSRRTRAAFGAVIVSVIIVGPSAVRRPVEARPLAAFDANGLDDSFLIAQSRSQGPVIKGSTASQSPTAAIDAALGDPVAGSFGPQVAWPIMPIHAVLLPDGRVMSYGTDPNGVQTAFYQYDVWNPRFGTGADAHSILPNGTQTDIFCSTQIVLLNGDVEVYGGDNLPPDTNTQNRDVNQFHPADNTLVRTGSMNRLRWYSSSTMLPNAEVYIQGGTGGADFPERRTSTGQFQLLTGVSTSSLSSGYPKNFVGPDGLVFGIASKAMYRVNPAGNGSLTMLGTFPSDNAGGTATSVMFAPGRILQVGGGNASAASRNASIIDINGSSPQVSALPQLQYGRHWGNATVMADGRVFVSGGSAVNNAATGVAYTSEIFDPATSSWFTGPTATRMRLYHSTSVLLPDATVITMGGGTPGPETNLNAEIYYPPYLFNSDGSPATRPTITTATAVADPATSLTIDTPDAAAISRVSLVKLGSVTHSVDMDQRFVDLPFTVSGTTLQATLPANANRTPPGHYMIFAINAAGVPSEAKIVRLNVAGTPPPPPTTTTTAPTTTTTTTTTTTPPTTTSTTTSTSTTTTSTTTTSTTTTTTSPPPPPPVNVLANGGFETNSVPNGTKAEVTDLLGWTNPSGAVEVWHNLPGFAPREGGSNVEIDRAGRDNRLEQTVATVAGRPYTLSFQQSPGAGIPTNSNKFTVYWNGTNLGTVARNGKGLTTTSWQLTTFTVTGTGNDRLSFRENDSDNVGALIDDVRLVAT